MDVSGQSTKCNSKNGRRNQSRALRGVLQHRPCHLCLTLALLLSNTDDIKSHVDPRRSSEDEGHEYEFEEDIEMSNARQRKVWKASIMTVWNQIAGLKYKCGLTTCMLNPARDANLFRHPVTNDVAAGYSDVVFRPMDLGTIKKRIDNGVKWDDVCTLTNATSRRSPPQKCSSTTFCSCCQMH